MSKADYSAAELVYLQIIEIQPENFTGFVGFGTSLLLQSRLDEAEKACRKDEELGHEEAMVTYLEQILALAPASQLGELSAVKEWKKEKTWLQNETRSLVVMEQWSRFAGRSATRNTPHFRRLQARH